MVLETVALVAFLKGAPAWAPGILIETFEDVRTCQVYAKASGWEMLRLAIGFEPVLSHAPAPGFVLECVSRT